MWSEICCNGMSTYFATLSHSAIVSINSSDQCAGCVYNRRIQNSPSIAFNSRKSDANDSPLEESTPDVGFAVFPRPVHLSIPKYVVSCEIKLISFTPEATSAFASLTTDSCVRERCCPRIVGIMQKEQVWLHPSAILMYAECDGVNRYLGVSWSGIYFGFAVTVSRDSSPAALPITLRIIGATWFTWSNPMKASTSGNSPGSRSSSFFDALKRCDKHPATMIFCFSRAGSSWRAFTAPTIVSIDSSLATSMNEQVLIMSTSARSRSSSLVKVIPSSCRCPTMISESIRFFAHPSDINPTCVGIPATHHTSLLLLQFFFQLFPLPSSWRRSSGLHHCSFWTQTFAMMCK